MTSIELRQKLINQIERLSFEKLLVLEKLIESLESHLPETSKNIDSALESPALTKTYRNVLWFDILPPYNNPSICVKKRPIYATFAPRKR